MKEQKREALVGYLFSTHFILGQIVFLVLPAIMSLYFAFCKYPMIAEPVFTGLDNIKKLMGDIGFREAFRNTLYYTIIFVPGLTLLALVFAAFLNQTSEFFKGKTLIAFRAIYYFPAVAPWAAIGAVWVWLLNTDIGLVNMVIKLFTSQPIAFLSHDSGWRIPSLAAVGIWKGLGYMMFIFLIGLNNIPKSLYEAAEIDGANWWQKLRNVTVPLLSPTTFFVMILSTLWAFQAFDQIYIMVGEGSGERTNLMYYLYNQGFQYFKMGYASAIAWVMFIFVGIITLIQNRLQKYWVHY